MPQLRKVLVANRGEIAVRVIRACRDAALGSVAVYADPDRDALFARMADESFALGGSTAAESYLDVGKLLDVAARSGADAVHPGYGFLAENADFAQAVLDAGLVWIGPSPQAIRDLGDKVTARHIATRAGAPLVPGTKEPVSGAEEVEAFAEEHGLPVAIKAAFGGGGRGLKVARTTQEIAHQYESAVREAVAAFGRGECFVERYLDRPRHVEAQILADGHGTVVVVGTRDCSLQRRHQKLVEEAPAPFLSDAQRDTITEAAKAICRAAGYTSAGTVEFLVGADGTVSFLEVNTRLQVEHPVTEETTGIDLVREQFRVAAGEPLTITADPEPRGHSIEFRINGEDAGRNFLPQPGVVTRFVPPAGPGVRVDSGVESGSEIGGQFDSLLAKVIVTGADRTQALERSRRALAETVVEGMATVLPFHRAVVRRPGLCRGRRGRVHRAHPVDRDRVRQHHRAVRGCAPATAEDAGGSADRRGRGRRATAGGVPAGRARARFRGIRGRGRRTAAPQARRGERDRVPGVVGRGDRTDAGDDHQGRGQRRRHGSCGRPGRGARGDEDGEPGHRAQGRHDHRAGGGGRRLGRPGHGDLRDQGLGGC